MRFHFDLQFDGRVWPLLPPGRRASFGEAWIGPERLIEWIELWTGHVTPPRSTAERIAETSVRLARLDGFFRASFEVEPLETTRRLIAVRDELVAAGFDGATGSAEPEEPTILGQWRAIDAQVSPGLIDRVVSAAEVLLSSVARLPLAELVLYEPMAELPLRWRVLVEALQTNGVRLIEHADPAPAASGDLGNWQRGGGGVRGDGTLQLLRPRTVFRAATELAAWIAALGDGLSVVVIGADSELDRALEAFGQPTVGASPGGVDDPAFALLDGLGALLFEPRDPAEVLALLTVEPSPIPRRVAQPLARALLEVPSTHAPRFVELLAAQASSASAAHERVRELFTAAAPAGGEAPAAVIRERLSLVNRWAQGMIAANLGDREASVRLVNLIAALRRVLVAGELDGVSRLRYGQLLRLADREVAPRQLREPRVGIVGVSDPSAVVAPVDVLVFWNFVADEGLVPRSLPLLGDERRLLRELGVALPSSGDRAARLATRMLRPLRFVRRAAVLCAPSSDRRGEPSFPHPLWDEIEAVARAPRRGEDPHAASEGVSLLATRPLVPPRFEIAARESVALAAAPTARRRFRAEPERLALRDEESPSSIETLARCPFRYHLKYRLGLRPGLGRALLSGPLLVGRAAHELIAAWLSENGFSRPEQAAIRELFERVGRRVSEALFLPGAEPLREEIVQITASALTALVEQLGRAKIGIVGVEHEVVGQLPDGRPLRGRVDLLLEPPAVLDYKWGSAKRHEHALQRGAAIQLSCYAWALESTGSQNVRVGYFVLGDQRFLTTEAWAQLDRIDGPTPSEGFARLWARIEAVRSQLERGELIATGLASPAFELQPTQGPASPGIYDPPCSTCEFDAICGRAWAMTADEPSEEVR